MYVELQQFNWYDKICIIFFQLGEILVLLFFLSIMNGNTNNKWDTYHKGEQNLNNLNLQICGVNSWTIELFRQ